MLLAACSDDKATTEPEAEPETGASDYVLLLDDDSDPDQVLGEPGAYALTARGAANPPLAVLDVPAGYSNFGFFALVPEGFPNNDDPLRSVQYWTVHGVFVDPCAMDKDARPAGTSVDDLVAALAAQKRTSVSEPVPVTLDGHDGLYLELTAPSDISFEDCALGYYAYWEGSPSNAQHTVESPGTIDRTWILDVDGQRVVLVAAAPPDVTEAHVAELTEMVESVRFVEPQ
jgi:hypothetical protein